MTTPSKQNDLVSQIDTALAALQNDNRRRDFIERYTTERQGDNNNKNIIPDFRTQNCCHQILLLILKLYAYFDSIPTIKVGPKDARIDTGIVDPAYFNHKLHDVVLPQIVEEVKKLVVDSSSSSNIQGGDDGWIVDLIEIIVNDTRIIVAGTTTDSEAGRLWAELMNLAKTARTIVGVLNKE